jgi:uncharacterized membrane protein
LRAYVATVVAPLIVVVVSLPLIAGKIKRNSFYGFRTPRTLASDAAWYPANRIGGILFLCAGLIWLMTGVGVGLGAIGIAAVVWFGYALSLPKADGQSN